jgi:hypothetical protein
MEGWLAITEELAAPLSKIQMFKHIVPFRKSLSKAEEDKNFDCDKDYGLEQNCVSTKKLSDYDNHQTAVFLAKLRSSYDRSMAEVQTRNLAIYLSNRNITLALFCSMLIYETLVTVGIVINADLPVSEGVLFTLYTITSAGFGNIVIPKTDGFLIFAVVNVFISISMLAVLVAQAIFYLQFEAVRRRHAREKIRMASSGLAALTRHNDRNKRPYSIRDIMLIELCKSLKMVPIRSRIEHPTARTSRFLRFLLDTESGRAILVASYLSTCLLFGAFGFMIFEDRTFIEGLYVATYGMLTVGHGDLAPVTQAGIWFTNCWLPFNVGFIALYLASVGHIYYRLSIMYTKNIEKKMRNALKVSKVLHESEPVDPNDKPQKSEQDSAQKLNREPASKRRTRIRQNSNDSCFFNNKSKETEIVTVRDLLQKLYKPRQLNEGSSVDRGQVEFEAGEGEDGNSDVLSASFQALLQKANMNDDFALRLTVLDRLSRIVSAQLIDFRAGIEVDGKLVRVTVESVKDWITEWKIPHRAKAVYRKIVFESLLFVGEKQLLDQGVGAFHDLGIVEFIELFSPIAFALDDTISMKEWLANTDDLAKERLPIDLERSGVGRDIKQHRYLKNPVENFFLVNPGNAVRVLLK